MRVLHLSWEYPPVVYGGLGRHVHALAEAQAAQGHDVVVITQAASDAVADERVNGVRVIRVMPDAPFVPDWRDRFIPWVFGFNVAVMRAAHVLLREWTADVVHAHDWLVAQAAVVVQESAGIPFVFTLHATEAGRQDGALVTDQSWDIHSTEWWAVDHADRVIVCSEFMRAEAQQLFSPRPDSVAVIPNGIDPEQWQVPAGRRAAMRRRFGSPLVVFAGRLEWEKGVQTLIDALPRLQRVIPEARAVVIGEGSAGDRLKARARKKGVAGSITFTGFVSEADLRSIVAAADVAVVPSLYEPFGFVALEAIVLGAPLVVASTGGLAEIVDDGRTGWTFPPGDPKSLAGGLAQVLLDPSEVRRRGDLARADVLQRFGWGDIAAATCAVYVDVIADCAGTAGQPRRRALYLRPEGNALRVSPR